MKQQTTMATTMECSTSSSSSSSSSGQRQKRTKRTTRTTTTTTEINVPVHIVWEYLSDLERWDGWNPCVRFNHYDVAAFFAPDRKPQQQQQQHQQRTQDTRCKDKSTRGKAKLAQSNSNLKGDDRKQTWLLVDCTIDSISRQELAVSWTTYRGLYSNTTVMRLLPIGNKRTLLKHTQTLHGPPNLAARLLGMSKHGRSILAQSVYVDQSLKNHVECQYFQTLLTDLSTSLPQRSMAKYLKNNLNDNSNKNNSGEAVKRSSHSSISSLKRVSVESEKVRDVTVDGLVSNSCLSSSCFKNNTSNDFSTSTAKTEQCSSDFFWQSPEYVRKEIISCFVEDEIGTGVELPRHDSPSADRAPIFFEEGCEEEY